MSNISRAARESAESLPRGKNVSPRRETRAVRRKLKYIAAASGRDGESATLEWLRDNRYMAERECARASTDFPASGKLPGIRGRRGTRALAAARDCLRACENSLGEEEIAEFLREFGAVSELSERELSAFPAALCLSAISALSEECAREDMSAQRVSALFTSLHFLGTADLSETTERSGRVESVLRQDPDGTYPRMDAATRSAYRREIARTAEKRGESEEETALQALRRARESGEHIGKFLVPPPPGGAAYILCVAGISALATVISAFTLGKAWSIFILFPIITEIVKSISDYFLTKTAISRGVPSLELEDGIPPEGRTLAVISVLLSSESAARDAAKLLETYAALNRDAGGELLFGLLADLPESKSESEPSDEAILAAASDVIERLNARHGGGFYIFARGRTPAARDGVFRGWERKRGAILQLARTLRGDDGVQIRAGDAGKLGKIAYVITLDADTRLCAGSARELVGAMLHPLNHAVIDEKKRVVTRGRGMLQPRIATELRAGVGTAFARLFSGGGGSDPYGGPPDELYQDVSGRGSFTGKGILDVDAYLKCTEGRFPQNLILSHDLLEGAYLNCAFKGDTQLTDGFPRAAAPYFERLHRWTRGDWQTVAWLLPRVRDESGRRVKNPLAAIDKWKIFDNLRRSLTPPCALAAILAGMLDARLLPLSALGAVSLILGHLVAAIDALARGRARPGRRFSYVPGAFGSRIASAFARLALLPLEASVCLTAAVTAVFRMSVSRRNLLQWVTAADSESRGRGGVARYARLGAPGILASLAVILLTPYPPAAAVAIVWALSPLIAASLGREERERGISAPDREYLLGAARDIWRYFAEFLTPEDNFLPPDNYQEAPFTALARRTSPTNIGLALLAPLAAHDLGIIDRDAAVETVGRTLASLQNLEKWRGHPYNWYDTATLQPLEPRYVSTVDSGNLAVCLTVLCGGLRELGETQLADLADTLCRDMDFAPLFDKKRRLFRIGRDMSGGAEQENVYDLMASESMLTSYFAVARGFAPRRHWRALSRAAVRFRGRTGMASWTGTAFEYLMPSLFLPYYKHSLLYESANFCVYSHKKSAKSEPWGSSESAFFAFDASGSYRYKAHGAPALALRRGMGRERVVAPYSSFLALAFDPKGASDNLRKLEELGAVGDYGFREALDFTEERTRGVAPLAVRTYMAHHLGMSIIAVANALGDGAFVRRLLSDADMGAFTELLGERVPAGERTIKSPPRELPERHRTPRIKPWRAVSDEIDAALPRVALLTAGDYGVTFSETGQSESRRKGVALTRAVFEQSGETSGITFFLKSGDELIPLQPAPLFDRAARYSATLSGSGCEIKTRSGKITARVITRVAPDGSGELRRVELASKTACECELAVYFEPVLAGAADYASHPAFSKLSLETELSENCAVVRRRPRGGERGAELAFACDRAAAFDTSRELALGRGGIYAIGAALRREPGGTSGAVLDPCVLARVKISLRPGKTERVAFALSASGNTGEAASRARKLLSRRDASESAAVSQFDAASARFGLSEHTRELAAEMLRELVYPSPYRRVPEILLPSIAIGREGLWSFGVSGDLPIVAQIIGAEGDLDATRELIGAHAVLSECGAPFDLLLLTDEGGEYTSPLRDGALRLLREAGRDAAIGARGGAHVVPRSSPGANVALAVAKITLLSGEKLELPERPSTTRPPQISPDENAEPVSYARNADGSFRFDGLPKNAWSHLLVGGDFGCLATDAGTGYMWRGNARENQINRWKNDSLATRGTERVLVETSRGRVSVFASRDGNPCRVTYGFGWARWDKRVGNLKIATTAFVPPDGGARALIIECSEPVRLVCCADIDLTDGADDGTNVVTELKNGAIVASNPYNTDVKTRLTVALSGGIGEFTCSRHSFLTGAFDGQTGAGFRSCASFRTTPRTAIAIATGDDAAARELADLQTARAALERTRTHWERLTSAIEIHTPDENLDNYINGWALYQTYACRMLARTSLYQCGGAYGFRDQLQDACALIMTHPQVAREHILRCAAVQFEEGDVLHWWHPGAEIPGFSPRGVRTRCSDDMLWLPYALTRYARMTGDTAFLSEAAPYISAPVLSRDESERYERARVSPLSESLLRHGIRAVELVISRGVGEHGLCLIGGGDWNDGMNLVGARGRGESVWLTWFFAHVADDFAELLDSLGDADAARRFRAAASERRAAAERSWDGKWFRRGYFDDGGVLGGAGCPECEIDSIAQSFAALAGARANGARQRV